MTKDKAYFSYINMLTRCYNRNSSDYARYGGRGVYVCDRWRFGEGGQRGFACFLADMGVKPEGMTLDRTDNNGPYAPSNCLWRTRQWQSRNRRTTVWVEVDGTRLCVNDWARRLGVSVNSLRSRASVRGGDYKKAIRSYADKPLRKQRRGLEHG